jgi:hypothetical protein
MSTTTRQMSVRNGVCSVIHTVRNGRTLCGRDAVPLTVIVTGMSVWDGIGWEAASKGDCQRCTAKRVVPITIDTTPAGIFAAMMRANASESAAPQARLYGLLSDYLRRTLAAEYGTVAAEHIYAAVISSGECSDDVIAYGLESVQYGRTEMVTTRDLHTGDTVSTDVGPVLLVKDNSERGLLSVRNFTGRILSIPSVPDHCTWILRSNVADQRPVDDWTVQGASNRLFRRYI